MCGIFGWALDGRRRESRDTLMRLTDMLFHRGPDGSGYWLGNTPDERFQIGLGHRRLSIIDVEGGVQPMASADGRLLLTYNGEIYNYLELRAELQAMGHRFQTRSDTEVLIEAFRAWDTAALSRLRGMFAFAIYDTTTGRMVLGRDPFGKKPLFLANHGGALVFASEIPPLIAFPGADRAFNYDALGHYMLNRFVPGPLTFFTKITKLQPGHFAVWEGGALELRRYFSPPLARVPAPDIHSLDTASELLSATFDESVRIRMQSDVPYGAFLSGGIDSSAVVAMMTRHTSTPIRTFSVGFEDPHYSELAHARLVAEHFATDHNELVVTPASFMEHWPLAVAHRGAPVSELSDIPILMLSQIARDSVKMVLTGEGSDEFMGGYPKHRADHLVTAYHRLMPSFLHSAVIAPLIQALPYSMRRLKVLAAAAGERNHEDRMRIWFGAVPAARLPEFLGRKVGHRPPDPYPFSLDSPSDLRRILFFDQTSWLPDNLLERGDRMMMAGSIEGRMPFMDTELAALTARFADDLLIGGKGGKTVLRAAMAKVLPARILERKKVGFQVPLGEWMRGAHSDRILDLLTGPESTVARLCKAATLQRVLSEHMNHRQNHQRLLWSFANLEMFIRAFRPSGI
jgi:asparagine synthase (glutamine-hydrolysing)